MGDQFDIEFLMVNILGSEKYAWVGILLVVVWQACAFNIILYLAGLQTVSGELYEASGLDGAASMAAVLENHLPDDRPILYN